MSELPRPSPTIHEAHVERHRAPDTAGDDIMAVLSDATRALRLAAESARDTTGKILANETQTVAARHITARETNARILEAATRKADAAFEGAKKALADLESRLAGPPR